jgi:hypothetical protein
MTVFPLRPPRNSIIVAPREQRIEKRSLASFGRPRFMASRNGHRWYGNSAGLIEGQAFMGNPVLKWDWHLSPSYGFLAEHSYLLISAV